MSLTLSGPFRHVLAVLGQLTLHANLPASAWRLRTLPDGRCAIRTATGETIARSWGSAVGFALAEPAPLKSIVVRGPGRWK